MQDSARTVNNHLPTTPLDHLQSVLAGLATATRVVLVYDPDGVTQGCERITDLLGREWSCILFWRNVLEVSLQFRVRNAGSRILICIVPSHDGEKTDLSYIPDMVGAAEEVLDLSLPGIISYHEPGILLPASILNEHRSLLSQDIVGTIEALREARRFRGRVPFTQSDVLEVAIGVAYPALRGGMLRQMLGQGVLGVLHLLFSIPSRPEDEPLLRSYLLQAVAGKSLLSALVTADRHDIAVAVYAAEVLRALGRDVTAFNIRGLGLDRPAVAQFLSRIREVAAAVASDQSLAGRVYSLAEEGLPKYLKERLQETVDASDVQLSTLITGLPGSLGHSLVRQRLCCALTAETIPESVVEHGRILRASSTASEADCIEAMFILIASIEERLRRQATVSLNVDALVREYAESGDATLEYDLWNAEACAMSSGDRDVISGWQRCLPRLRRRIRERLSAYDAALASVIRADVPGYLNSKRTVVNVLHSILGRRGLGHTKLPRLWLVIFDGMRWDMWERVVRPILEREMEVKSLVPFMALIPSTTKVSRTSLVASQSPDYWMGVQGTYTTAEDALFARAVGIKSNSWRQQLFYLSRSEDRSDAVRAAITVEERRAFNLLIFNMPDDWIHHEQIDVYQIGRNLATQMEGVLASLRSLVEEDDVVLVASDHGFLELDPEDGIDIKIDATYGQRGRVGTEVGDVGYRYTRDLPMDEAIRATFKRLGTFYCATGHRWYNRPGGSFTRYAQGGISLSELLVPAALMQKRPTAVRNWSFAWNGVPEIVTLSEDEAGSVHLTLAYDGTEDADYSLKTSSGRVKPASGTASPQASVGVVVDIEPRAVGAVSLTGVGTTRSGRLVRFEQASFVIERTRSESRVRFDTSALDLLEAEERKR